MGKWKLRTNERYKIVEKSGKDIENEQVKIVWQNTETGHMAAIVDLHLEDLDDSNTSQFRLYVENKGYVYTWHQNNLDNVQVPAKKELEENYSSQE